MSWMRWSSRPSWRRRATATTYMAGLAASLAEARDYEDGPRPGTHLRGGASVPHLRRSPHRKAGRPLPPDGLLRSCRSGGGDACIARTEEEFARQHGAVPGGRSAILAFGRLGSREMTAGSDLDLIVIYEHDPDATASDGKRPLAPSQYYTRLTQRLVAALSAPTAEGVAYRGRSPASALGTCRAARQPCGRVRALPDGGGLDLGAHGDVARASGRRRSGAVRRRLGDHRTPRRQAARPRGARGRHRLDAVSRGIGTPGFRVLRRQAGAGRADGLRVRGAVPRARRAGPHRRRADRRHPRPRRRAKMRSGRGTGRFCAAPSRCRRCFCRPHGSPTTSCRIPIHFPTGCGGSS